MRESVTDLRIKGLLIIPWANHIFKSGFVQLYRRKWEIYSACQIDQSLSGNYAKKCSHSPIWESASGFPRNSLDLCVRGIKLDLNRKRWVDALYLTMHRKPKWNRRITLGDQVHRGTSRVAWTIIGIIGDSWTAKSTVRISKSIVVDGCPSPWRCQVQIAWQSDQKSFKVRVDSKSPVRSRSVTHREISNDI
jgi:hypothetical protein